MAARHSRPRRSAASKRASCGLSISSCTLRSSLAAHACTKRDAHAGGPALKWSDKQLTVLQEIEPGPVKARYSVKDERRSVRRIGNEIGLVREQARKLTREACVVARLVLEFITRTDVTQRKAPSGALGRKANDGIDVLGAGREHQQAVKT
jgi:hypothetical protein